MQKIKTAFEFTKNLWTTGALYETSKKVEAEISKYVNPNESQVIVEFGAGHGNITKSILAQMNKHSKLYAFEVQTAFCNVLREIKDDRLIIINDSAQFFDKYVAEELDCIISSIPFSFISDEILNEILSKSHARLKNVGVMSQVLYSAFHLKKYKMHFQNVSYKILLSMPPEFIYHAKKN